MKKLSNIAEINAMIPDYSLLTAIELDGFVIKKGKRYYLIKCECKCGNIVNIPSSRLAHGKVKSCGCLLRTKIYRHGLKNTKLYNVWNSMKERCCNGNTPGFHNYGGRGIKVCQLWRKHFIHFYNWCLNNGYQEGLELDRINNDGDYKPSNCRFVTRKINCSNRRMTIRINYNSQNFTISEWAEVTNLSVKTIYDRYKYGKSPSEILANKRLIPVRKKGERKIRRLASTVGAI